MRKTLTWCSAVAIACSGWSCVSRGPIACPEAVATERTVPVYFATDRVRAAAEGVIQFGTERMQPPGLHLGKLRVALGPKHRLGAVDAAVAVMPISQSGGAGTNGSILVRGSGGEMARFADSRLRAAIRASRPSPERGRRRVLFFIHGYNSSFDYAVRKTAQLAGDLGLVNCHGQTRGVAISYSWPSYESVLSYMGDEENAEWTEQRLTPFLSALAQVCRQENAELYLVAHSMGSRALVRSLADLSTYGNGPAGKLADHVVLLAPDIGKGLFEQYIDRFVPHVGHLTIYVSARDRALALSTALHGGRQRLGLFGATVIAALELTGIRLDNHRALGSVAEERDTLGRIDMIDVTQGFASQFGHSYEDPKFIADLRALLNDQTAPGESNRANLKPRQVREGIFEGRAAKGLRYFSL
jgi:esterase/lipase superfamily enzyme